MGEKGFDFRDPYLLGMPLVMEEDVALDSVYVGLLGANGVDFEPDGLTHLVKQLFGRFVHRYLSWLNRGERNRLGTSCRRKAEELVRKKGQSGVGNHP